MLPRVNLISILTPLGQTWFPVRPGVHIHKENRKLSCLPSMMW